MSKHTTRRNVLKGLALGGSAMITAPLVTSASAATNPEKKMLKGNVNHSVCRWTYSTYSVEDLCKHVKDIGFAAIDLVGPKDWPTLKQYGIFSSMCNGAEISINDGWNNKQFHPTLLKNYSDNIDLVSQAGYKNLICFSGARKGMDDETGLKNCAEGLKQIMAQAEKKGVIVQMELLNSKVNHKDYMCDRSAWGVELCKRIGSPNFKLLYDIYHMQIDEGDVIRTIRDNHQYFGHYHTGGVPGRNEIDDSQELYYPAIVKCIFDELKFTGYLAQEFIPAREDKIASLRQAIHICDV
ncbi:MAG: TIM barrel protein [Williamsia sp.]|nr:TIM barrel protein [Williamsia sp.]